MKQRWIHGNREYKGRVIQVCHTDWWYAKVAISDHTETKCLTPCRTQAEAEEKLVSDLNFWDSLN